MKTSHLTSLTLLGFLPLSTLAADVLSVSGDGYMDWNGDAESGDGGYVGWSMDTLEMNSWDGSTAFTGSKSGQAILGDLTLDFAADLQASLVTSAETSTFSYADSWSTTGSVSGPDGDLSEYSFGDATDSSFTFTFVVDGPTLLTWDYTSSYYNYIDYSGNGVAASGPYAGQDYDGALDEGYPYSLLLTTGTHVFSLQDGITVASGIDSGNPSDSVTMSFTLMFSNVVPGPPPAAALLALGLTRVRRRRG